MNRQAFALLAIASACTSKSTIHVRHAEGQVEEMLRAELATLERGETEAAFLALDAFSWGTGPRDLFTSREALARSTPRQAFVAHDIQRHVYLARDGQS